VLQTRIARAIYRSPRLHPVGAASYRFYMRLHPHRQGPKVIGNGLPKAGTHLLTSLLDAVPGLRFSGRHYSYGEIEDDPLAPARRLAALDRDIQLLRRGQYMSAHLIWCSDVSALLHQKECRMVTILRDPRAVALSDAKYLAASKRHPLHDRVLSEFPDLDDRINAVITGFQPKRGSLGLECLAERFERYLGWLDDEHTCVIRYEELVGPRGGGSLAQQHAAVDRVLRYLGVPNDAALTRQVADAAYSTTSATFQQSQIEGRRDELSRQQRQLIESTCSDSMRRLGYAEQM